MKLSDHPLALKWLQQFDGRDIYVARLLLDGLKLVSSSEIDSCISNAITAILNETAGEVAVFPIDKRIVLPDSKPSSADRLAHNATGVARTEPRLLVNPGKQELIDKKVRNIILVDDFSGTGQRVSEFWEQWPLSSSVRSWFSYGSGQLKVWLVGYAIHEIALKRIQKHNSLLSENCVRFALRLSSTVAYWPEEVTEFCERNAHRTGLPIYPMGFGGLGVPLVFQHGCPDNCPVVLWKNGGTFRALFPERGIPATLHKCFSGDEVEYSPKLLWDSERHKEIIDFIQEMASGHKNVKYVEMLTIMRLLRRGYLAGNLGKIMTLEITRIWELLNDARKLGLVDENIVLTDFGKDIIDRTKEIFLTEKIVREMPGDEGLHYIPRQFNKKLSGVQRKSSKARST